jgi:hypothetical protein
MVLTYSRTAFRAGDDAFGGRFGERRPGGNWRKLPEAMDTDAFRAGGMGVAAMQYG